MFFVLVRTCTMLSGMEIDTPRRVEDEKTSTKRVFRKIFLKTSSAKRKCPPLRHVRTAADSNVDFLENGLEPTDALFALTRATSKILWNAYPPISLPDTLALVLNKIWMPVHFPMTSVPRADTKHKTF